MTFRATSLTSSGRSTSRKACSAFYSSRSTVDPPSAPTTLNHTSHRPPTHRRCSDKETASTTCSTLAAHRAATTTTSSKSSRFAICTQRPRRFSQCRAVHGQNKTFLKHIVAQQKSSEHFLTGKPSCNSTKNVYHRTPTFGECLQCYVLLCLNNNPYLEPLYLS